jgi:hypothetical protein
MPWRHARLFKDFVDNNQRGGVTGLHRFRTENPVYIQLLISAI